MANVPQTRLDEKTIARDARVYFQEIIKNTKMKTKDDIYCECGGMKIHESDYCKDCI